MNNLIMEKAHSLLIKYLQDNAELNVEDAGKVADFFTFKRVKRLEVLEREGKVCNHFYFIAKGCLRLYEIDKKGKEITGRFALENSFISAVTSFIAQRKSLDFLVAYEPSEIFVINRSDFYKVINSFPGFAVFYRKLLEFAFVHSQMRVYIFLGMEGIDRLKWIMEHEPELLTRVSSKAVASYLGMTNSTLSKLKSRL